MGCIALCYHSSYQPAIYIVAFTVSIKKMVRNYSNNMSREGTLHFSDASHMANSNSPFFLCIWHKGESECNSQPEFWSAFFHSRTLGSRLKESLVIWQYPGSVISFVVNSTPVLRIFHLWNDRTIVSGSFFISVNKMISAWTVSAVVRNTVNYRLADT